MLRVQARDLASVNTMELWYYRLAAESVDAVNMNILPQAHPASVLITEPSPRPESRNFERE